MAALPLRPASPGTVRPGPRVQRAFPAFLAWTASTDLTALRAMTELLDWEEEAEEVATNRHRRPVVRHVHRGRRVCLATGDREAHEG